jgi:hypothetical protein
VTVRWEAGDDEIAVETSAYRLVVDRAHPVARFTASDGRGPMRLFLLTGLDSDRGLDSTLSVGPVSADGKDGAVTITIEVISSLWTTKTHRLHCTEDEVSFVASVSGEGQLTSVRLLGGTYTGNPRWGGGMFHSEWSARTLFDPSPDDPRSVVLSAAEPATVGVVGNSLPGRGHWFFTPAPLLFAGNPVRGTDPGASPAEPWQTMELRPSLAKATFTEFRYAPFLGGFSLELAYESQTTVAGSFSTPPLVIRTGVKDPYSALAHHADALRRAGLAPTVRRDPSPWWTRPIFCGWGEQSRTAKLEGGHPTSYARQDRYDAWLGLLADRGVVPGTIVIDDKWQTTYGCNEPDRERWPDLRRWIADRHAAGQRVLLWFKAWDPEGLPPDACVTDALGQPVAADPTSPAYAAILRTSLRAMLGPDGLDADGLKVDFTAQTPSGPGLRRSGDAWGIALLHRLMALVYEAAKAAKADSLIVTHTASPYFVDTTDMIRLNDLMRLHEPDPFAPAVAQMRHRARVASSIEPGMLIDTDDWCMPSKAEWRDYLAVKPELGVPALYYATGIDHSGEAFDDDDYAAIRRAWAAWEARRVQGR